MIYITCVTSRCVIAHNMVHLEVKVLKIYIYIFFLVMGGWNMRRVVSRFHEIQSCKVLVWVWRAETGCDAVTLNANAFCEAEDLLTLTEQLANLKGVCVLEEFSVNELNFSSKCWQSSVIIVPSLQLHLQNWIGDSVQMRPSAHLATKNSISAHL